MKRWPLLILGAWLLMALLAGLAMNPLEPRTAGQLELLAGPSAAHWLGTDDIGRDVLARLVHGARAELVLAAGVWLAVAGAGTLLGALAAGRRRLGMMLALACDVVSALPPLILVIAARAWLGAGGWPTLIILLALRPAADLARVVVAVTTEALAMPYVEAARAAGASPLRLRLVHALPAAWPFVAVASAEVLAQVALAEAALGFLGLGLAPPTPTWGDLLAQAHRNGLAPHLALPAGLAVTLVALAANRLADRGAMAVNRKGST
jgi:peptide/nickel transport system permease protein